MVKESSIILKVCNWVLKYSIYAVIFLVPIFFLPWTTDIFDFNKQALLIFLSFIALFAWMLKVLISGKLEIRVGKIHTIVSVLFLVSLLATLFSVNRYGSFWGWPQSSSESLFTLIGFVVVYFLVSSTFPKKSILTGVVLLSISALITEIIGILQLLGLFIFSFSFARSVSFNTVGSVGALGFLAAILLPLTIMMLIVNKKWWRILFGLQLVLSASILFLINYSIIWWVVFIGSAFLMIFGVIKRNLFDGRWVAIPVFFLTVSLFFILLNPQFPWLSQKVNEVFLSQKTSLSISSQAIKERPIFGSGPGTFSYDFLKFKDPNFSQSALWNISFNQAGSKVLSDLASTGILGLIALLSLMAFPIFYGIKFLVQEKSSASHDDEQKEVSKVYWILILGVLIALINQAVTYFLYNSNITLGLLNFLMIASMAGLITSEKKEYELKPSSLPTLIITFVFTLLFIFGLGLLILDGQRYVAELDYNSASSSFRAGNNDAGLNKLESAASLNPSSDLYLVQLSQVYLAKLQSELKSVTTAPSDTEKAKIQTLIANSVNAAKMATDLNPKNSNNWTDRGFIYQSLNGLIGDSSKWSLSAYDNALQLNPNDPYALSQEGAVNFVSSMALGADKYDQKTKLLNVAKSELERAIALNPNYSNGLYSLGLVYDALGQQDKAIEEFTKVQQLNPKDATIPKILSNLNAGLPALQSAPPPVPPENTSSNSAVKNLPSKQGK